MGCSMSEFTLDVKTPAGPAVLTLAQNGRYFEVVDFEVAGHPELSMAFAPTGSGVENLDERSDVAQCFNLSTKICYGNVVLGNLVMRANSREELEYALKQVKVRTFNHEEI